MAVEQSTLTAKKDTVEALKAVKSGGTHDEFLLSLALAISPEQLEEARATAASLSYEELLEQVIEKHGIDPGDLDLTHSLPSDTGSSETTLDGFIEVRS